MGTSPPSGRYIIVGKRCGRTSSHLPHDVSFAAYRRPRIQLKRQNKIFFPNQRCGHEGVLAAAGLILRPGYDWIYPYYRDRALCLEMGVTPLEMLLHAMGLRTIQTPEADRCLRTGEPSAEHFCAVFGDRNAIYAGRRHGPSVALFPEIPRAAEQARLSTQGRMRSTRPTRSFYVSGGEGSTSEGEFSRR